MKILTNKLHEKAYKTTWMYNPKVLKKYSNHFTVKNTKTGGTFKKSIETYNYNKNDASIDSVKKFTLKEDWVIKTVESIALNKK